MVKKMIVDDDCDVSIIQVENNKNMGGGKTFCFCSWWSNKDDDIDNVVIMVKAGESGKRQT